MSPTQNGNGVGLIRLAPPAAGIAIVLFVSLARIPSVAALATGGAGPSRRTPTGAGPGADSCRAARDARPGVAPLFLPCACQSAAVRS